MSDLQKRLRAYADWLVSCALGNIPEEAATAYEAASRISQQDAELEQYRTAFRAIIERSHNDPLGTSKVVDMRRIAEAALGEKP